MRGSFRVFGFAFTNAHRNTQVACNAGRRDGKAKQTASRRGNSKRPDPQDSRRRQFGLGQLGDALHLGEWAPRQSVEFSTGKERVR